MPPPRDAKQALLQWIIADKLPFSTVKSLAFRNFLEKLCPAFKLPSASFLANQALDEEYSSTLEYISLLMQNVDRGALTTDGWTGLNTSFWSLTFHGITSEYLLFAVRLGCFPLYAPKHDAPTIATLLENKLEKIHLDPSRVIAVVTDEGGAAPCIAEQLDVEEIHCAAHLLNTVLKRAFQECIAEKPWIGVVLTLCRNLAALYNQSTAAREQITVNQLDTGEKLSTLKQDIITRWNSRYFNLRSILESKESLIRYAASHQPDPQYGLMLRTASGFWDLVERLVVLLQAFHATTTILSSEIEPTLHLLIPNVLGIIAFLNAERLSTERLPETDKNRSIILILIDRLLKYISAKFEPWNSLERMAFALSPFHKPKQGNFAWNELLKTGYADLRMELAALEISSQQGQQSPSCSAGAPITSTFPFEKFMTEFNDTSAEEIIDLPDEVTRFSQIRFARKQPILEWWRSNQQEFPNLSKLARAILCIPATQTTSEREFSQMKLICTTLRNRLDPERANKLSTVGAMLRNRNMRLKMQKQTPPTNHSSPQAMTAAEATRRTNKSHQLRNLSADPAPALQLEETSDEEIVDSELLVMGDGERESDKDFSEDESADIDASLEPPKKIAATTPTFCSSRKSKSFVNIYQTEGRGHSYHAIFSENTTNEYQLITIFGDNSKYIVNWQRIEQDSGRLTYAFEASVAARKKFTSGKQFLRLLGEIIYLN